MVIIKNIRENNIKNVLFNLKLILIFIIEL